MSELEPETMQHGGLLLQKVKGRVDGPHYHKTTFKCALCQKVQSGLVLCGAHFEQISASVECEQCTSTGLEIIAIDKAYSWIPTRKP